MLHESGYGTANRITRSPAVITHLGGVAVRGDDLLAWVGLQGQPHLVPDRWAIILPSREEEDVSVWEDIQTGGSVIRLGEAIRVLGERWEEDEASGGHGELLYEMQDGRVAVTYPRDDAADQLVVYAVIVRVWP